MPAHGLLWRIGAACLALVCTAGGAVAQDRVMPRADDEKLETLPAPTPIMGLPVYPPAEVLQKKKLVELAAQSGQILGPLKVSCQTDNCSAPVPLESCQERWMHLRCHLSDQAALIPQDYRNMYCSWNIVAIGAAIAIAAPLANTSEDEHFRAWYQHHATGGASDHWANEGRRFGNYWIVVPVVLGASYGGRLVPETVAGDTLADWGDRSIRGLIVGAPAVAILQVGLGTARPGPVDGSAWNPGHGHQAVATEGFVGAVPFLAAASMTKNRPLRWAFIGGSFIATWANLHSDSRYLSQSLLGWSVGAVAAYSVCQTETRNHQLELAPIAVPKGMGVGLKVSY